MIMITGLDLLWMIKEKVVDNSVILFFTSYENNGTDVL
jgi:hypothetical protein